MLVRTIPVVLALATLACAFGDAPKPLFERDIVPILSAHCWKCHGMENRKAGLDLRTPVLTLRGSDRGPVIVKGSAEKAFCFRRSKAARCLLAKS